MPKISLPFVSADMSCLARSLRAQLGERPYPPSHVDLLNMLARALGYRNHQHLRAQASTQPRTATDAPPASSPVDTRLAEGVARHFDGFGQLVRLPGRPSHQALALWPFWADLPSHRDLSEAEVGRVLCDRHLFGDQATLRRMMVSAGLISRTADGRVYRRIERKPPPDALLLIKLVDREPGPEILAQAESFLRRRRRTEAAPAASG